MAAHNPLAFRPRAVMLICSLVYIACSAVILYVACTVPQAPATDHPVPGIDLKEAHSDLQHLTKGPHPYNSRANDRVRTWLLARIDQILADNGIDYAIVQEPDSGPPRAAKTITKTRPGEADAVIFNDLKSNVSFSANRLGNGALSTYYEGTNVIVYVRGKEDSLGAWWESDGGYVGERGVLVNAHYDSVSTAAGATDDGVGVVTVLQLLRHFTMRGFQPSHGIVFLLNNGEEDFLNGARAFARHPTAVFADRFLNLEGAGAGGRAALFRTTDVGVTRFYQSSPHPFASSTSDDGFKAGLVKSDTDYHVFHENLNMRGLDVAFVEPRSRYHTVEDDSRHTSRNSLWHMLSSALPTTQNLAENAIDPTSASDAVWFDLFGRTFAVMELHTLFALQVTLLVIAPIDLFIILIALRAQDKLYLLSRYKHVGDTKARIGGLKGLFRAPVIFIIASACTFAIAFLLIKFNPLIVSSSPWAVWACFISLWLFMVWFQSRFADYVRPSALHRLYTLVWLHFGSWILAVVAAIGEDRRLSSGYPILFLQLGLWLSATVALLELFAADSQTTFATEHLGVEDQDAGTSRGRDEREEAGDEDEDEDEDEDDQDEPPTERTALLPNQEISFRPQSRRTENTSLGTSSEDRPPHVYKYEQHWSEKLLSSLWVLEFLLAAVPALLFLGPIMTFVTFTLSQTLSDGGGITIYLVMAALSIVFLAPLQPFIHRFTFHIPLFLLLVFAGTLIYNLVAFPFSATSRLKVYFVQEVDLDSGINTVAIAGADSALLSEAVGSLPSASDVEWNSGLGLLRNGLYQIKWSGLPPTVVQPLPSHPNLPPELAYEHWLQVNATRAHGSKRNKATISLRGRNTRNCKLIFDTPVSSFYVQGSSKDNAPFPPVPKGGTTEIRLWHREWDLPWTVEVTWQGGDDKGLDGRAVCLWNRDESQADGGIPAFQEVLQYAPVWLAVTKNGDGLVEGSKRFMI